jgi:sugar lactone lactonase YvrE
MRKPLFLSLLAALLVVAGLTATALASKDLERRGASRPSSYIIPGDRVFPEGIARVPGSGTFFVGSTTDGAIFRGDLRSSQMTSFAAPGADGRTIAVGMKADRRGRLVVAGGATGKIFVLSTKDGSTLKVLDTAPGTTPTFLNDVVIADGFAYVTDSQRPILFRFALGKDRAIGALERFVDFTGTPFAYTAGFNANGITASRQGRLLTIVQTNTGKLFRVDTKTKEVSQVDLGGVTFPNGDGLLQDGRRLYVVQNQQELIVPVKLSRDGRSGKAGTGVTGPQLQFPTTIARDGRRLLAVGSQFDKRSAGVPPELPFDVATIAAPKIRHDGDHRRHHGKRRGHARSERRGGGGHGRPPRARASRPAGGRTAGLTGAAVGGMGVRCRRGRRAGVAPWSPWPRRACGAVAAPRRCGTLVSLAATGVRCRGGARCGTLTSVGATGVRCRGGARCGTLTSVGATGVRCRGGAPPVSDVGVGGRDGRAVPRRRSGVAPWSPWPRRACGPVRSARRASREDRRRPSRRRPSGAWA